MNIQAEIEALESLAIIDSELSELNQELDTEREALSGKKAQLRELEEKLQINRSSVAEMDRMRGELVGEVRQMSIQLDKSREKLGRCRTEREANAAQREVEETRKLYRDRELEIEKLTGLADQAKGEMDALVAERDVVAGELGESEGARSARLREVEKQIETRSATRKAAASKVQPVLYRRYEMIRKRRGSALAHTSDGTCAACHMLLPPMMFQKLMRGEEFGQCPSCNRILYFRAVSPGEDNQAADDQPGGP